MQEKRNRDQIKAEILTLCQGDGQIKTKIVYLVGLNFETVKDHLDLLIEKGLIEVVPGKHPIYKTTSAGESALKHHRAIEAIYS